jgi:hypothetical protein
MVEDKELLETGQKVRAGRMLSEYLRAIGAEKTEREIVFTDPDTGVPKIISKVEALARDIWRQAMGGEDEKIKIEYRKMLLDRIEGRPGTVGEENSSKRRDIPDKVSEKGKKKLNSLVKK